MRIDEIIRKRTPVDQSLPHDDHSSEKYLPRKDEPWRGPHEGRYLRLLLNGTKPMAIVDPSEIQAYQPYIEKGKLIVDVIKVFSNVTQYAVALPNEAWRIPRIRKLYSPGVKDSMSDRLWHAKVGILLGYTNHDIRKFINDNPLIRNLSDLENLEQ